MVSVESKNRHKGFTQHHFSEEKKNSAGFTVLFSVLIASLVLTIGLSVFNITLKEFILSSQIRDSQFAFYSADAGLECALYWDRNYSGPSGSVFGGGVSVGTLGDQLIRYWKLDNTTGLIATDSSIYARDGSLEEMESGDWDPNGIVGGALDFDGVDEYIDISGLENGLNSIDVEEGTISVWVKFDPSTIDDSPGTGRAIFEVGSDENACSLCTDGHIIGLRKTTGNTVTFRYTHAGAVRSATITNPDFQDFDSWTHLAATWEVNGSDVDFSIYKNGTFIDSNTSDGIIDPSDLDSAVIGRRVSTNSGLFFHGQIDEARVYTRALNQDEINTLALNTGNVFIEPIDPSPVSGITCNGAVITDPGTGWKGTGWERIIDPGAATTTFDISFDNGYCAEVKVGKTTDSANIESRGYNTCTIGDPRRVERALRLNY